jgi:apolipoprotein N-acyltransferase
MAVLAFTLEDARAPHPPDVQRRQGEWRRGFSGGLRGLAFGVGANVVALRFVPNVVARFTPLPWAAGCLALVLLACEQGARWAVAAIVGTQLTRRGVPAWLAFGMGVYTGTFVPSVFPWSAAGGVTPIPAMIQLAEFVGERGVTLLMAVSAGLLASAPRARFRRTKASLTLATALLLPLLMLVEGRFRIAQVEAERRATATARVGLVQPSTEALERWDPAQAQAILQRLTSLTRTAESQGAELTLWPEAAYPLPVAHALTRCPIGARAILPSGVRGPVLTGLIMTGADGDLWNSAAICRTDGTMTRPYDKIHLLWFGESIPFVDRVPWVRRVFSRGTGLIPGEHNVVQVSGLIHASILNCFEDTLPEAGREAMTDRPNLLVNLTNDAWFAGSAESELHLRVAVLRAVESRRDFLRAVNFGPTTWVDAAGVVEGRYDNPSAGTLVATVALLEGGPTLYDRFGDLPTALTLVLITLARVGRKMEHTGPGHTKSEGRRAKATPSTRDRLGPN